MTTNHFAWFDPISLGINQLQFIASALGFTRFDAGVLEMPNGKARSHAISRTRTVSASRTRTLAWMGR